MHDNKFVRRTEFGELRPDALQEYKQVAQAHVAEEINGQARIDFLMRAFAIGYAISTARTSSSTFRLTKWVSVTLPMPPHKKDGIISAHNSGH